jgi:hypothetical protein
MLNKIIIFLIVVLTTSAEIPVQDYKGIEIFDINRGCVVKRVEPNPAVQKDIESYLKGITGIYAKFNPIPIRGFMVKIPLKPNVKVKNKWFDSNVDIVIIIFPEHGKPYLMLFEEERRPIFLIFEGDTSVLLKRLDFKVERSNSDTGLMYHTYSKIVL